MIQANSDVVPAATSPAVEVKAPANVVPATGPAVEVKAPANVVPATGPAVEVKPPANVVPAATSPAVAVIEDAVSSESGDDSSAVLVSTGSSSKGSAGDIPSAVEIPWEFQSVGDVSSECLAHLDLACSQDHSSISNAADSPLQSYQRKNIRFTYDKELTVTIENVIGDFGSYFNKAHNQKYVYQFGDIVNVSGYSAWKDRFVYAGFLCTNKYPEDSVHLM